MKKLFLLLAALFFALAVKSQAQSDLIARIHFLGAEKISADTSSLAFTNEFSSAEARALESQTLDKLSRAPGIWFKSKIPASAGDGSTQLRPLLDDLLKSEWTFETRDTANGSQEYALAIHLNNERAQLWQNNLRRLLESWTGLSAQKIPNGWELKKHQPPNLIRFEWHGDWIIVGAGQNELSLSKEILQTVSGKENDWLSADLNWPRLAQLFPALIKLNLPKTEMQVVGRAGDLQFNGKFSLTQPLSRLDNWQVPTNALHQPFVSFTAMRGIKSWLERQSWLQPYELSPTPNQIFIWALAGIPFQTFISVPVPNATNALMQINQKFSAGTDWQKHFIAPFTLEMTNNQIFLENVPFVFPNVEALHGKNGDFLVGGLFPNTPRSKPLPQDLFAQLATPNLVYYHWEITAERLPELQNILQLGLMLTNHKQLDPDSAGQKWLTSITPKFGNTVTKVTEITPTELDFSRKAPGGLTAVELFAFASWLEATNFPGCDLRLPPPRSHLKNRKALASPPAMVPAPH